MSHPRGRDRNHHRNNSNSNQMETVELLDDDDNDDASDDDGVEMVKVVKGVPQVVDLVGDSSSSSDDDEVQLVSGPTTTTTTSTASLGARFRPAGGSRGGTRSGSNTGRGAFFHGGRGSVVSNNATIMGRKTRPHLPPPSPVSSSSVPHTAATDGGNRNPQAEELATTTGRTQPDVNPRHASSNSNSGHHRLPPPPLPSNNRQIKNRWGPPLHHRRPDRGNTLVRQRAPVAPIARHSTKLAAVRLDLSDDDNDNDNDEDVDEISTDDDDDDAHANVAILRGAHRASTHPRPKSSLRGGARVSRGTVDDPIYLVDSDDSDIDQLPPPMQQAVRIQQQARRTAGTLPASPLQPLQKQQQKQHRPQQQQPPPLQWTKGGPGHEDRARIPTRPYDSSDDEAAVLHERMADLAGLAAYSSSSGAAIATKREAAPSLLLPSVPLVPAPLPHPTAKVKPVVPSLANAIKLSPPIVKRVRSIPRQGRSSRALSKDSREAPLDPTNASTAEPSTTTTPATKSRYMREKSILKDHTKRPTTTLHPLKPQERHLTQDTRQFLQQMNTIMQPPAVTSPRATPAAASCSSSSEAKPGQIQPHFLHSTRVVWGRGFDRKRDPGFVRKTAPPHSTSHPPTTPSAESSIPAPPSQVARERSAENSSAVTVATTKAPPPPKSPVAASGPGGGSVDTHLDAVHDERMTDHADDGGACSNYSDFASHSMEVDDPHDSSTDIAEGSHDLERSPSAADTGDSDAGSVAGLGVDQDFADLDGDGAALDQTANWSSAEESDVGSSPDFSSPSKLKMRKMWEDEDLGSSVLSAYLLNSLAADPSHGSDSESDEVDYVEATNDKAVPSDMAFVDLLTKEEVNPLGLPTKRVVCYGDDDRVLYEFLLEVEQSTIPGADWGAFVTFLGARRLNKSSEAKAKAAMLGRVVNKWKHQRPKQIEYPRGYGASFRVTGEHLYGKDNLDYLFPEDLEYEPSSDNPNGNIYSNNNHSEHRIGNLRMHKESDYVPDRRIKFDGRSGSLLLGRYGPFRRRDRRVDEFYAIKNYIFDQGPAEYAFGVSERLRNRAQLIDITCDVTGLPHDIARGTIPMYVNEVGHCCTREQNVFIRQDRYGNRVVQYFFVPARPMNIGDKVELLTNYFATYEKIRESKGYGAKNLKGMVRSSEECRAARYEYDFEERDLIEKVVFNSMEQERLSISEVTEILEDLHDHTWEPLEKAYRTTKELTCRQWVCMRRIQWLAAVLRRRIDSDEEFQCDEMAQLYPYSGTFQYCRDLLGKMEWRYFGRTLSVIQNIVDVHGKLVKTALQEEVTQEILYSLRDKIPKACNKSFWCPIAVELIEALCERACSIIYVIGNDKDNQAQQKFMREVFKAVVHAAERVKLAARDPSATSNLEFESGLAPYLGKAAGQHFYLVASIQESLKVGDIGSSAFYLDNSTLPKGLLASVCEKLAYIDSLVAADMGPPAFEIGIPLEVEEKFIMYEQSGFQAHEPAILKMGATPRSVKSKFAANARINEVWYLVWQVLVPAHAIARKFLSEVFYSYKRLCDLLDIDPILAKFALSRGIQEEDKRVTKRFLAAKSTQDPLRFDPASSMANSRRNNLKGVARIPRTKQRQTSRNDLLNTSSDSSFDESLKQIDSLPLKQRNQRDKSKAPIRPDKTPNGNAIKRKKPSKSTDKRRAVGDASAKSSKNRNQLAPKSQQSQPREKAVVIYEGPPTKPLDVPGGWPKNWFERTYRRMSGATKGGEDSYWYTPLHQKKLRSIKNVKIFLELLKRYDGDEEIAYSKLPTK